MKHAQNNVILKFEKKKTKKCASRSPLVMASLAGILRGSGFSRDARSKLPLPTFQIFPY